MSKIQFVKRVISPLVDDIAKHVTPPQKVTVQLADDLARQGKLLNISKLSDDLAIFCGESLENLAKNKSYIPEELYTKLETAILNKNFKLKDIVSAHYSRLTDCKRLDEVAKLYPEIKIPEITPKTVLKDMFAEHLSVWKMKQLQELAKNGNPQKIDEFLENTVSPNLKNSEKYSDIKGLIKELRDDIISGNFVPNPTIRPPKPVGSGKGLNTMASLYGEDFDGMILEMLKRHYINGENLSEIAVTSTRGINLTAALLRKQGFVFPALDKHFRQAIANIESKAPRLVTSSIQTKEELLSEAVTNAWKVGNLKNQWRALAKHWKILEPVWLKNTGVPGGMYDTNRLIDNYLLNKYLNGIRESAVANPFAKYIDNNPMNQKKKIFLEMLYLNSRTQSLIGKSQVKDSKGFQAFKSQFDIEAMSESVTALEQHYQKAFLKQFWGDTRRRDLFSKALQEEFNKSKQYVEITEDVLNQVSSLMITK